MQYFVSIENSSFFYWQMELLIESFIMHGLQDNLVIAIAQNDDQKINGYSSNLVRHGRKFMHANFGRESGHLPLNRVASLRAALADRMLEFPFAILHADMIMRTPLTPAEDSDYGMVLNNYDEISGEKRAEIKEAIAPGIARIAEERKVDVGDLPEIPVFSAPIVFNESFKPVSEVFFARLHSNTLELIEAKGCDFPCERAAWELTITESFQHCSVKSKFMAGSLMGDNEDINFIHYKNGIPPVFHKNFFKFNDMSIGSGQCPYEVVLEHNPTISTGYMHEVIRSYNDRKNR
jgi:hypothetical protein